jgi:hypothetical protein
MEHASTIADAINAKRAAGYDAAFEALMRQPWYCPNCKAGKTILNVLIPLHQQPEIAVYGCSDCGESGIRHLADRDVEQLRKVLDAIEPFDRSGRA